MILKQFLYVVASLITVLSVFWCFKHFIGESKTINLKLALLLVLGSFINSALFYTELALVKNIYSVLFFILIFKISSKKSFHESLYYAILLWIYGMAVDIFSMLTVAISGFDNVLASIEIEYARVISTLIISLILFLISFISPIKKFTNNIVKKLVKIKPSLLVDIVFIIIIIFLSIICIVNIKQANIVLCAVIVSVLFLLLLIVVIDKNYNVNRLKEVNNLLIKNNEFFIKLDADYRVLKHNLTNQLLGIRSVADNKTKKLLDDLIANYNSKFIASQDIKKIPEGINGLIYEKLYNFNCNEIKFAVENNMKSNLLDVLKPRKFNNLCELIGIAIDNSLEATLDSKEKCILIDFEETKDSIVVKISNTFKNSFDLEKIGNMNYSTKNTGRGLGLFSILTRNGIITKIKIINNLFQNEIKVKKSLYK